MESLSPLRNRTTQPRQHPLHHKALDPGPRVTPHKVGSRGAWRRHAVEGGNSQFYVAAFSDSRDFRGGLDIIVPPTPRTKSRELRAASTPGCDFRRSW
jgi:hypothetical protein